MIKLLKKYKLIIFAIVFIVFFGTALAKYVSKKENESLYEAGNFYFCSNELNNNEQIPTYTLKTGIDYIEFTINNNEDNLRFSENEINYKVIITDLDGNEVKDKNEKKLDEITSKLEKNKIDSKTHKFENLKDGMYKVTATSTKPYKKEISAIFIITNSNKQIDYQVVDTENSPILKLIITTHDYSGDVVITWPDNVTVDNTIDEFRNVKSGYDSSSKTITVNKNSEYIYQFFKKDPTNLFSKDDFEVGGA